MNFFGRYTLKKRCVNFVQTIFDMFDRSPERTMVDRITSMMEKRAFLIWAWIVLNLARVLRSDVVVARHQFVAILMPSSVLQAVDSRRRRRHQSPPPHRHRRYHSPPPLNGSEL